MGELTDEETAEKQKEVEVQIEAKKSTYDEKANKKIEEEKTMVKEEMVETVTEQDKEARELSHREKGWGKGRGGRRGGKKHNTFRLILVKNVSQVF